MLANKSTINNILFMSLHKFTNAYNYSAVSKSGNQTE